MIDIDPTWRAAPERSDAATLAVTTTSTKKRSAWRTQIRHERFDTNDSVQKKTSSKILKISVRRVFFPTNTWRKMFGINPQHDYDTFALRCHQLRWKIPPFRIGYSQVLGRALQDRLPSQTFRHSRRVWFLVGGWALWNMTSSVGMMTFPTEWEKMFQTSNYIYIYTLFGTFRCTCTCRMYM